MSSHKPNCNADLAQAVSKLLSDASFQRGEMVLLEALGLRIEAQCTPERVTITARVVSNNPLVQKLQRTFPVGIIDIPNDAGVTQNLYDALCLVCERVKEFWPAFNKQYLYTFANTNPWRHNIVSPGVGQVDVQEKNGTFVVYDKLGANASVGTLLWVVRWGPGQVRVEAWLSANQGERVFPMSIPDATRLNNIAKARPIDLSSEPMSCIIAARPDAIRKLQEKIVSCDTSGFPVSFKQVTEKEDIVGIIVGWTEKQEGIYRHGLTDWTAVMPAVDTALGSMQIAVLKQTKWFWRLLKR